ncbi:hypothetical protein ACFWAR_19710 [Streptomyces sp. NPDC059917]|uniref:hypothetical protein n=1 Tax=Streptomyces sp. NPDC059917 TaxID=3347002 RepID=UPI00364D0D55
MLVLARWFKEFPSIYEGFPKLRRLTADGTWTAAHKGAEHARQLAHDKPARETQSTTARHAAHGTHRRPQVFRDQQLPFVELLGNVEHT